MGSLLGTGRHLGNYSTNTLDEILPEIMIKNSSGISNFFTSLILEKHHMRLNNYKIREK